MTARAFAAIPRARMLPGETLAHYRALDSDARHRRVDGDYAQQLVDGLPLSWADKLLARWRQRYGIGGALANGELRNHVNELRGAARAGLQADSSYDDVCQLAAESTREAQRRIDEATHRQWSLARTPAWPTRKLPPLDEQEITRLRYDAVRGFLDGLGLGQYFHPMVERKGVVPALRRVCDIKWWRRVLWKVYARAVESTARAIGLVHARAGCYASDDAVMQRRHQLARHQRALESTIAINEEGQTYSLAEAAAKGQANKSIRRGELMVRIKGFDIIAVESGHDAIMATVTCPSRMHAWRTRPGGFGTEPNPSFDGTTQREGHEHLTHQWEKCRSAAARAGLQWYGFRISEPNHDGTPHWHLLLFFPKLGAFAKRLVEAIRQCRRESGGDWGLDTVEGPIGAMPLGGGDAIAPADVAVYFLRRYFLCQVSPGEAGASKRRVKVERIDRRRGDAAGYVAKYVAKNIDGYRVEKDLLGNDAIVASERVESWASRFGIRQFQQIGGAPVGVWRELRRMNELQAAASPLVAMAIDAVNTTRTREVLDPQGSVLDDAPTVTVGGQNAAHGWATYLHLQGGPTVKRRSLRLRVLRESTGEVGRYGELMAPKPVGVVAIGIEQQTMQPFGVMLKPWTVTREVSTEVESERHVWVIVPRSKRVEVHSDGTQARLMHSAAAGVMRALHARREPRPWSPVNNCTDTDYSSIAGVGRRRVRKRGFPTNWSAKREGAIDGTKAGAGKVQMEGAPLAGRAAEGEAMALGAVSPHPW